MPASWRPQLAAQASTPPVGDHWIHEIKHDGYRTLAFIESGRVRLITRGGHDWTHRYGTLDQTLAKLPCGAAILDGEVAVPDARGVTTLSSLQRALVEGRTGDLVFYAFDLCHLDGHDLSAARLIDRKAALSNLIATIDGPQLRFSEHTLYGGMLYVRAQARGAEGVVSKRADAPYVHIRASTWVKVKPVETGRFTVIGFIANRPERVSSLILAEEAGGRMVFSGRAGAGIDAASARNLYARLIQDERDDPPVAAPQTRGARWVEPMLNVELGFNGRTASHRPRAPVILSGPTRVMRRPSYRSTSRSIT